MIAQTDIDLVVGSKVLTSFFKVQAPILIANETFKLSFDVVDSDIPLLLGKETMKSWNFTIFTGNDAEELTSNNNTNKLELYTLYNGHWWLNVQQCFPIKAINSLLSAANLSQKEKSRVATRIHGQFCHPSPLVFLKKVLPVFNDVDNEFLSILEKYCKYWCLQTF